MNFELNDALAKRILNRIIPDGNLDDQLITPDDLRLALIAEDTSTSLAGSWLSWALREKHPIVAVMARTAYWHWNEMRIAGDKLGRSLNSILQHSGCRYSLASPEDSFSTEEKEMLYKIIDDLKKELKACKKSISELENKK